MFDSEAPICIRLCSLCLGACYGCVPHQAGNLRVYDAACDFGRMLIWIKARACIVAFALAPTCTELVRKGSDFPTTWTTKLKGHSLVKGIPHQRVAGRRTLLDIQFITGSC